MNNALKTLSIVAGVRKSNYAVSNDVYGSVNFLTHVCESAAHTISTMRQERSGKQVASAATIVSLADQLSDGVHDVVDLRLKINDLIKSGIITVNTDKLI